MIKKFKLILFLLISNFIYSQFANFDLNGNLNISSASNSFWEYRYKQSGTSTYSTPTSAYGTQSVAIKLNPFISWDISKRMLGSTTWTEQTINSDYVNITPKTFGYNFNFDTSTLEEGWRNYRIENTTSNNYSNVFESTSTTFGNTGKSLNYIWGSNYKIMMVSPKISDLSTDKKFSIYSYKNQSGSTIQLGTMSNPYDPSTFHNLKTVTIQGPGFEKIEVFMNNYLGGDNYIAIKTSSSNGDIFLDHFNYEQSINCFDISNFSLTNNSENSAQINFNADSAQNTWEVNLTNTTNNTNETFLINSNNYQLQNLVGNSNYQVKIRAFCAQALYTNWTNTISFTTICTTKTAGYQTSFHNTSYIDPCWSKIIPLGANISQSETALFSDSSTTYNLTPRTGNKYIKITGSTSSYTYFVSPNISDLNIDKRIKFFLTSYGNYVNSPLTIGTMLDPNNESTFIPIKTINPTEINEIFGYNVNEYWKEHIIYLNNYNTNLNHHYIAFRHDKIQSSYLFIDDFTYELSPNCKEPVNLYNNDITNNTAEIKWEDFDNSSTEWEIQYGVSGFALGTGTNVISTTNPHLLTNLLSSTIYDFYVRTKCGNNYSNWSDRGTFKTKCDGVTVGFTDNFENSNFRLNTCWNRITAPIRDSFYKANNQINYNSSQFKSGINSIKIYHGVSPNLINTPDRKILVTPKLLDFNNDKMISFWSYANMSGIESIQIGTLSNPNDYTTFTLFKEFSNLSYNQWIKFIVDFSNYTGNDKYVGIRVLNTSTNNTLLYIDDFEYYLNPCNKPSNLTAEQTNSNSAILNWQANSNITNWEIEYGVFGFTPGTGNIINTSTKPYILTGLNSNQKYQFRVRNLCQSNFANWSELYYFKISCTTIAPLYENFDQITQEEFVNLSTLTNFCWSSNEDHNNGLYSDISNQNVVNYTSPPNSLQLSNGNTNQSNIFFISPFLTDFNQNKKLKFWVLGYLYNTLNSSTISIGTIRNPMDVNTYEEYQTLSINDLNSKGKEFYIDFQNYTGSNKIIAFKLPNTNVNVNSSNVPSYVTIDDIIYDNKTTCKEPINIQFNEITNNSVKINWEANSNIQIEYGIEGFTPGNGITLNTNQNEIFISNLNELTNYEFYFKSICTNENSIIIGPKKIRTSCAPNNIPWSENFNTLPSYGINTLPPCMNILANGFTLNNYNINTNNNNYDDDNIISGNGDSSYIWFNENHPKFTSPPFNLIAGTSYKFSLDIRKNYEYGIQHVKVSVGRGNNLYGSESDLFRNGSISEYNYNTNTFIYTPIENGQYTFFLEGKTDSADNNLIIDNLSLIEAYPGLVNSNINLSNNNNLLVLEKTNYTDINLFSNSGNNEYKLMGSSIQSPQNIDSNSILLWEKYENNLTKINFKVGQLNSNPLVLKFDLKQTFNTSTNDSQFRVVVNGIQINNNIKANTNNSDDFITYQYDLTPFSNNNIYVSLQHFGKNSTNIGNHAFLKNIEITNILNSEEFNFKSLKVYPNPTKDIITINNYEIINSYEITNITGQDIEKKSIELNDFKINIDNYPTGIYLLKLNSDGNSKSVKIVKE